MKLIKKVSILFVGLMFSISAFALCGDQPNASGCRNAVNQVERYGYSVCANSCEIHKSNPVNTAKYLSATEFKKCFTKETEAKKFKESLDNMMENGTGSNYGYNLNILVDDKACPKDKPYHVQFVFGALNPNTKVAANQVGIKEENATAVVTKVIGPTANESGIAFTSEKSEEGEAKGVSQ